MSSCPRHFAKAPGIRPAGSEVSHSAQQFHAKYAILKMAQESSLPAKLDGLSTFLRKRACPDEVVRGPLPLMFISRNPQSVAFHGGHFGRAAPITL